MTDLQKSAYVVNRSGKKKVKITKDITANEGTPWQDRDLMAWIRETEKQSFLQGISRIEDVAIDIQCLSLRLGGKSLNYFILN